MKEKSTTRGGSSNLGMCSIGKRPGKGLLFRKCAAACALSAALVPCLLFFSAFFSYAAVFNVYNAAELEEALGEAGENSESDTINIHSDTILSRPLKHTAEDYPLRIRGNGFCIDGAERYRCLEIRDGKVPLKGADVWIDHLTFRRGAELAAGGLLVNFRTHNNSSRITIEDCTFTENKAKLWEYGWGGGAYIISYDGDIEIRGCEFSNNTSAAGGGALKAEASGSGRVSVTRCRFIRNVSGIWYGGALVHAVAGGGLNFSSNTVSDNVSYRRPAGGVGIWVGLNKTSGGYGTVFNNLICGNKSDEVSGVYAWARGGSRIDLTNNTIVSNPGKIGLYLRAETFGDLIEAFNNIIWNHEQDVLTCSGSAGKIRGGFNCYAPGKSDVRHEKDTTKPPKFTGEKDYHLSSESPCIDAGLSGSAIPGTDLDGVERPQGKGIDIGAYEFRAR